MKEELKVALMGGQIANYVRDYAENLSSGIKGFSTGHSVPPFDGTSGWIARSSTLMKVIHELSGAGGFVIEEDMWISFLANPNAASKAGSSEISGL